MVLTSLIKGNYNKLFHINFQSYEAQDLILKNIFLLNDSNNSNHIFYYKICFKNE